MGKKKEETRVVECCSCHKDFKSPLDSQGIPWFRVCKSCKSNHRKLGSLASTFSKVFYPAGNGPTPAIS